MTVKTPRFTLLISKRPAIGHGFVEANQIFFLREKTYTFTVDGKPTAMPRYYKRKIFDGYEDIKEEINDALAAKVAEAALREIMVGRSLYPNCTDQEIERIIQKQKLDYNERYFRTNQNSR